MLPEEEGIDAMGKGFQPGMKRKKETSEKWKLSFTNKT